MFSALKIRFNDVTYDERMKRSEVSISFNIRRKQPLRDNRDTMRLSLAIHYKGQCARCLGEKRCYRASTCITIARGERLHINFLLALGIVESPSCKLRFTTEIWLKSNVCIRLCIASQALDEHANNAAGARAGSYDLLLTEASSFLV